MYLRDQLERMTQLRPLPRWDYVHDYHFAGYLQTPDEILKWIDTHPVCPPACCSLLVLLPAVTLPSRTLTITITMEY
jgi:hypothetical protein